MLSPVFSITLIIAAYGMWGIFPLFFKLLADVPALEVLAHRVVWSLAGISLMLLIFNRWFGVKNIFRQPRVWASVGLSSLLVSVNWGTFIWAVANDRVLEGSLGYFIAPLVSLVLGVAILRERMHVREWFAVALAVAAVGNQVAQFDALPWVALTLGISWGGYGLVRKMMPLDSLSGLFYETLILMPVGVAYLLYLYQNANLAFGMAYDTSILLMLAGPVTVAPLLLFVFGVKGVRLGTAGLLQYIVPTMHFFLAVFLFDELFSNAHMITFGLIWLALFIYSSQALSTYRAGQVQKNGSRDE